MPAVKIPTAETTFIKKSSEENVSLEKTSINFTQHSKSPKKKKFVTRE